MAEAPALRVPPHSVEAEQGVLGAVLLDNRAFEAASAAVSSADFYRYEHRLIWQAAEKLIGAGKPADLITVHDWLAANNQADDVGGLLYLSNLVASVATASHGAAYAAIVRERSVCRRVIAIADDLATQAFDSGTLQRSGGVERMIDGAMVELLALQRGAVNDEPTVIADVLPGWIDALDSKAQGMNDAASTGLRDVDRLLSGGLRPGELMVVGARPSMGKSSLCGTIARHMAQAGPVLFCTMEDSQSMLVSRQVASAGRVNLADIRSPDRAPQSMWSGVTDGVQQLMPLDLHIDDRPALALRDVRRKAMQVARRRGSLRLVIVDYLQLMQGEGDNRHQQLGAIAAGLKALAKELKCVVLLVSQLNREADKTDTPPRLDHLRESGSIEEAADIVALLWRAHRRKPTPDNKHQAQLEFAKHKNGPTDTVRLWFDGATQRFADAAPDDRDGS